MADGRGKGKSNGTRFALRALSGGMTISDLLQVKNSLSVPLDSKTLPGVTKVSFVAGSAGNCEVITFDSTNDTDLATQNIARLKQVPCYTELQKAVDTLLGHSNVPLTRRCCFSVSQQSKD